MCVVEKLACGEPGCAKIVDDEQAYHEHYRAAHIDYYDDAGESP